MEIKRLYIKNFLLEDIISSEKNFICKYVKLSSKIIKNHTSSRLQFINMLFNSYFASICFVTCCKINIKKSENNNYKFVIKNIINKNIAAVNKFFYVDVYTLFI